MTSVQQLKFYLLAFLSQLPGLSLQQDPPSTSKGWWLENDDDLDKCSPPSLCIDIANGNPFLIFVPESRDYLLRFLLSPFLTNSWILELMISGECLKTCHYGVSKLSFFHESNPGVVIKTFGSSERPDVLSVHFPELVPIVQMFI